MMQQKNCDKCSYACYLCNSSQIPPQHQDFRSNNHRRGDFFTRLLRNTCMSKRRKQEGEQVKYAIFCTITIILHTERAFFHPLIISRPCDARMGELDRLLHFSYDTIEEDIA